MFVVQISLLIVAFPSLISQDLSLMQITKEVNLHTHIAPYVNMWGVTFSSFFVSFLLMPLVECWCMCPPHRPRWPSGVGPHQCRVLTSPLCYSIISHATLILQYHASMLTLQNSMISRAL